MALSLMRAARIVRSCCDDQPHRERRRVIVAAAVDASDSPRSAVTGSPAGLEGKWLCPLSRGHGFRFGVRLGREGRVGEADEPRGADGGRDPCER
jgi:hypothetical protein